jgi:RimJ/RimL family protein N-acetyltransferase
VIDDFFGFLRDVTEGFKILEIPIRDESGSLKGNLVPITKKNIDSTDAVRLLTEWRNRYRHKFFTQFVATEERTRIWLEKVVFETPGQMLFLIYEDDKAIGHLGFKHLPGNEFSLDNLIKADRSANPKIIIYVHKALVKWIFDNTTTSRINGQVFSDNIAAIMMNRQIEWKGWTRRPVVRRIVGNEIAWGLEETDETVSAEAYIFDLYIEREAGG